MPRFIVPVAITLTARDAQHGRIQLAAQPGDPRADPHHGERRDACAPYDPAVSTTACVCQKAAPAAPGSPVSRTGRPTPGSQVLALAQLLHGGTEALANLIEAALSPD